MAAWEAGAAATLAKVSTIPKKSPARLLAANLRKRSNSVMIVTEVIQHSSCRSAFSSQLVGHSDPKADRANKKLTIDNDPSAAATGAATAVRALAYFPRLK